MLDGSLAPRHKVGPFAQLPSFSFALLLVGYPLVSWTNSSSHLPVEIQSLPDNLLYKISLENPT
jgi:hypothetical protein